MSSLVRPAALVAALLGCFFVGAPAYAGYVTTTQTFSIPLTQTDWSPTTETLAGLDPFAIQKFNAAANPVFGKPGVLMGVAFSLDYKIENTITVQFNTMSTIDVTAQGSMHLLGPSGNDLVGDPTFTNKVSLSSTPQDIMAKTVTLPTKVVSGTSAMGYTDAATLAAFTGTGTISLPLYASATSTFSSSSGNGGGTSLTLAMANLTVTYFIAPEPSSFVLAGCGLGSLGVLALRRRGRRGLSN